MDPNLGTEPGHLLRPDRQLEDLAELPTVQGVLQGGAVCFGRLSVVDLQNEQTWQY